MAGADQPALAPDTNRELDAARQRVDGRSAQMTALDGQATVQGDPGGQLEAQYDDLDAQNKLDQWRMTRGYLDQDGVVSLPEPADYLDEMTGAAPGTTAAKGMTAAQTNVALQPFGLDSMQLSSEKALQARVAAGDLTPAEAAVQLQLIGAMAGGAGGARRGRRAGRGKAPSPVEQCPPTAGAGSEPDRAVRVTNQKHHPNSQSPEPSNVQELYNSSIPDEKGRRWVKDDAGMIHRFSAPSNNETHWNGSTAGPDPIQNRNIPPEIRRAL